MTSTLCPTCSCQIPSHAPEGLCPRCLVSAGLVASLGTQPAEAHAALLTPEELDELLPDREVEALIGRGGMGAVYLARDPRLGRRLAIKVLSADLAADPAFLERFAREARAVARLEHPNVVQIHQFVDDPDLPYLELEFVPGQNLRELLRAGPLRLDRAREILRQVAAGLGYAHREGVVHRDVKPENILVDEDGRVRLVDFGLAKITSGRGSRSVTLTGARQVVGTVHYMAPEQLEAPETVDARSDVYSWGVIAYEVLTGRLPLGRFGPPSRYAEVTGELDEIVLRALEREPEDRFANGGELRARLEGVAGGAAVLVSEEEREPAPARGTPIAWGLIALALVLGFGVFVLALVILLALFWTVEPLDPPQPPAQRSSPLSGKEDRPTAPGDDPEALTSDVTRVGEEAARLRALEAGARLQNRIATSYRKLALREQAVGIRDGALAFKSANSALLLLAGGDQDLADLAADAEDRSAVKKAAESLRLAREVARCIRIQAAVTAPTRDRVRVAQDDVAVVTKGRSREDCSNRVLSATGSFRLLVGLVIAAEEDFKVWRARNPKSFDATLGLAEAHLECDLPAEAAKLLEELWNPKLANLLPPRIQDLGLRAALETDRSEDRRRWLARLPVAPQVPSPEDLDRMDRRLPVGTLLPSAGLLKARTLSSTGDLLGALDELRTVFPQTRRPAAQAKAHNFAAEIFLTHELPDQVRAQAKLLRALPRGNRNTRAKLWEGLADASETKLEAHTKFKQVVAAAAPWEWKERASALRALARLSFEANDLEAALKFATQAHEINQWDRKSVVCLVRIQVDPYFEGKHLGQAQVLCEQAKDRRETSDLTGLHAHLLSQQFTQNPSRQQRAAKSVPVLVATPLLLDLRDRGSDRAELPEVQNRLRRAERQASHLTGRACALGHHFEFLSREGEPKARKAARARAQRAYRRAIWHYPFHLRARLGLARLARDAGEIRSALAHVKLAYAQHPKAPAAVVAAALLIAHDPNSQELRAAFAALPQEYEEEPALVAASVTSIYTGNAFPLTREQKLNSVETMFEPVRVGKQVDPSSEEALAAKTLLLRYYAKEFTPKHPSEARQARARADELEREFKEGRIERAKRLRALLDEARNRANNQDYESALAKAREACTLAPDQGLTWAAYADLSLRMRQPREALRASAIAAWRSDHFLPLFLMCLQVAEQAGRGPFGDSPPAPKGPGLRSLLGTLNLVLGGASSAELSKKVYQRLNRLDQLYPTKLAISCFQGCYALDRGKFEAAMVPLHYAARVHPDQGPLPFYAGVAAGSLEGLSQPLGDTLAILNLRQAKALGVDWKDDLIPERLRRSKAWPWVERSFDLSTPK